MPRQDAATTAISKGRLLALRGRRFASLSVVFLTALMLSTVLATPRYLSAQEAAPVVYEDEGFWLPEQMTTVSPEVDAIWWYVMWVSVISTIGITVVTVAFVIKYRRRPGDQPYMVSGPTHNTALEIWWSAIPLLLVAVMFFWGLKVYVHMGTPPADAYTIDVKGRQWAWDFQYPNGMLTTNELHVVKGQDTRIRMTSNDVMHAFWVPSARVKMDVLPGRMSYVWFNCVKATGPKGSKPAEHKPRPVYCAEFCGQDHSTMIAKLYVHEDQEDYQNWLDTYGPEDSWSPAMRGLWFYENKGCKTCHSLDTVAGTGPGWMTSSSLLKDGGVRNVRLPDGTETTVAVDQAYITNSIKQPQSQYVTADGDARYQGAMPVVKFNNESDYTDIFEFIKSLAEGTAPASLPE